MIQRGDRVSTDDGRVGFVQHWGMPGKSGRIVKTSRREAMQSGEPHVFVWFGEDKEDYISLEEVNRQCPERF